MTNCLAMLNARVDEASTEDTERIDLGLLALTFAYVSPAFGQPHSFRLGRLRGTCRLVLESSVPLEDLEHAQSHTERGHDNRC
eukprot:10448374-Alexandrium_andersonii.AAC.1